MWQAPFLLCLWLDELEPLVVIAFRRFLPNISRGRFKAGKHNPVAIGRQLGDTQAPVLAHVKGKSRGTLKARLDGDNIVVSVEVAFNGAEDTDAIFMVLDNAPRLDARKALVIGRNNAELERMEILIPGEVSDKHVVVVNLGHEGIEERVLEHEGPVLVDVSLGEAPFIIRGCCCQSVIFKKEASWSLSCNLSRVKKVRVPHIFHYLQSKSVRRC